MDFIRDVLIGLLIALLIPVVLIQGIWLGIALVIATPFIVIGFGIWLLIKHFSEKNKIPEDAEPAQPPSKPIMVKWKGKEVPLSYLILSVLVSIIVLLVIIYAVLFVVPPYYSVPWIILFFGIGIGRACIKR